MDEQDKLKKEILKEVLKQLREEKILKEVLKQYHIIDTTPIRNSIKLAISLTFAECQKSSQNKVNDFVKRLKEELGAKDEEDACGNINEGIIDRLAGEIL